jgi:serine protease inhibitor
VRWPFAARSKTSFVSKGEGLSPTTRFSFKLLRELAKSEGNANLFFSPFSIMMCLLMLHEGATAETRDAIAKVLEIADDEGEWRHSLLSLLQLRATGTTLSVANSLWCDDRTHVKPEFVACVREAYGAEAFELSLPNPASVARINDWVAKKTAGKIQSILSELQPLAALVAVNAIYFKGKWTSPFEPGLTRAEPFYPGKGPALHLPFMRQSGTYDYLEKSMFQAIRLPYGEEERLAAYIFLPQPKVGFASFQEMLTSAEWDE